MILKTTTALGLALISLTAMSAESFARGVHRMAIYDANSGKKIYDDGKLDGKACAVGKRAIYNPKTGTFITVPAATCNF